MMPKPPRRDRSGRYRLPGIDVLHDGEVDRFIEESESMWQTRSGELDLRVPARLEQLSMLRAISETVLLTADFTIDLVVDMRVALDEVMTSMVLAAVPEASVECTFRYDSRQVQVRVASVLETDGTLEGNVFGRSFLETLTDSMEISVNAFDTEQGGYPVVVHLSRLRSEDDDR